MGVVMATGTDVARDRETEHNPVDLWAQVGEFDELQRIELGQGER